MSFTSKLTLFLVITALIPTFSLQSSDNDNRDVKNMIRGLGIKEDTLSISVRRADNGEELVSINPGKPLNPASNIKILTSYCALKDLGVNFKWETSVLAPSGSPLTNGTVVGNIYIVGGGDPYMVSETLWMMAKELINRKIQKIVGEVVLDSTAFAPDTYVHSEEFLDDYDRSFTAPPCALSLNFNTVTINVNPDEPSKKPSVTIDPDIDYFDVLNNAMTVADARKASPKISIQKLENRMRINVYGLWSKESKRVHYRRVYHPELYFGAAFKKFYETLGGNIEGSMRIGKAPEVATKILAFQSRPLSQCVYGLNKFSNNFMADQILFTMGMERYGKPGNRERGLKVLNECLDGLGLREEGTVIESASGLSRRSRISPAQITSILSKVTHDFKISPEFMSSLGIYGEDGTVKKRQATDEISGSVRVKTGSLNSVEALSGYIHTKRSNTLAFSLIANGFKESKREDYRRLEKRLINFLTENF